MTCLCPNCNAENPITAAHCQQCGTSLGNTWAIYSLNQAESSVEGGDYARAETCLDAVRLWLEDGSKEAPPATLTARYYWLHALVHYYKGENRQARAALLTAMPLLEGRQADKRLLTEVLNTLGNIEYLEAALDAAAKYYKRCAQLAEQIAAHSLAARAWLNLGIISMNKGRHSEALFVYNKATQLAEASNDIAMKVLCYRRMCYVYVQIGPLSRAGEYAERIIELLNRVPNQNQVCQALIAVAVVYDYSGEFDKSIHYLRRVMEMAIESDNKLALTNTMMKLSQTYWDMGDSEASHEIASKLFADPATPPLAQKELAVLIADYYIKSGDFAHALKYINWMEQFDRHQRSEEQVRPYLTIAHFYAAQGDWARAARNFEQAIDQSKQHSDMYQLGYRYFEYGKARHVRNSDDPAALAMLKQAATIFQRVGAIHLLTQVEQLI